MVTHKLKADIIHQILILIHIIKIYTKIVIRINTHNITIFIHPSSIIHIIKIVTILQIMDTIAIVTIITIVTIEIMGIKMKDC